MPRFVAEHTRQRIDYFVQSPWLLLPGAFLWLAGYFQPGAMFALWFFKEHPRRDWSQIKWLMAGTFFLIYFCFLFTPDMAASFRVLLLFSHRDDLFPLLLGPFSKARKYLADFGNGFYFIRGLFPGRLYPQKHPGPKFPLCPKRRAYGQSHRSQGLPAFGRTAARKPLLIKGRFQGQGFRSQVRTKITCVKWPDRYFTDNWILAP